MFKSSKSIFIIIFLFLSSVLLNVFVADKKCVNPINYLLISISGINSNSLSSLNKTGKKQENDLVDNKKSLTKVISQETKKVDNINVSEDKNSEVEFKKLENSDIEIKDEAALIDNVSDVTKININEPVDNDVLTNLSPIIPNEKETFIQKEEDEPNEVYEILTVDEFSELLKNSPFSENILKLSSNASSIEREETFKKMFLVSKDSIETLIPFLRSSDKVLVINLAELLSIFNSNLAVPELLLRFNFEQDDIFREKLIKIIGDIEDPKAYKFLNNIFINTNSIPLMMGVVDYIYEYPQPEAFKKAENLIENSSDIHFKTLLHKFYIPVDKIKALDFAKTWIATHDARLDLLCLSILIHSERTEDWEYIDKYKRAFFKSVDLMEAFFKAKSCMLTFQLKGNEKFNAMEGMFSSNKLLLAWLSLYVAKKREHDCIEWLKKFSLRHNLFEYSDFIRAMYILDLPLPDINDVKESELKKTLLQNEQTISNEEKISEEKAKELSKIKFFSLPDGAKVYSGKNEIILNDELIAEMPIGNYKIKIMNEIGVSNVLGISVNKNDVINIECKKYEKPLKIENQIGIIMQFIPNGEFVMGSKALDLKEHLVRLTKDIFVSIYEVTNKQYEKFKPDNIKIRDKRSDKDTQPVIMVSWYDAINFCNWLSEKEKLLPAYNENCIFNEGANGYRLLTEAEWEYCARGGFSGKMYPWGDIEVKNDLYFANYYPRGGKELDGNVYTSPVGSYSENGFGLFDMAGNVSEWCNDWYDEKYYNSFDLDKSTRNPLGPLNGSLRVTRGASWQTRDGIKCAYRSGAHPMDKSNYRGFRVAKNMPNSYEYEIKIIP